MKRKIVLVMLFAVAISVVGVCNYKASGKRRIYNKDVYEYAKAYSEKKLGNSEIYSNGVVSKKEIEKRVKNIDENLGDSFKKSVEEIVEDKVSEQALYMYACDNKYDVSDEELDILIDDIKDEIQGTEEKELIDDFIDGSGMTQEEYWDMVKERYRVTETINKCLKDYEKKQIAKKNIDIEDDNYNEEIMEIDEELKKKAEKKYRVKVK